MGYFLGVIVFLIGLLLGSFFNVCIYRIPREQSIIFPPSYCPFCCKRLTWRDLIPVFSWIFLRGKCRYCKQRISYRYPLIELTTGLIFLLLYIEFGISGTFLTYSILCSILIIATVIDIEHQIIPNGLVLTGTVAGIALTLAGLSVHWKDALIGILAGGGTFLLVAFLSQLILKKEGMGGGDIKLMAMIGLMIGWKLTVLTILVSVYAGGLVGGLLLLCGIKKRGDAIPYGPFIAAGTIVSVIFGDELILWYLNLFL